MVHTGVSGAAMSGAGARQCASQKWSDAEMQTQGCRTPDLVPHHQGGHVQPWGEGVGSDAFIWQQPFLS